MTSPSPDITALWLRSKNIDVSMIDELDPRQLGAHLDKCLAEESLSSRKEIIVALLNLPTKQGPRSSKMTTAALHEFLADILRDMNFARGPNSAESWYSEALKSIKPDSEPEWCARVWMKMGACAEMTGDLIEAIPRYSHSNEIRDRHAQSFNSGLYGQMRIDALLAHTDAKLSTLQRMRDIATRLEQNHALTEARTARIKRSAVLMRNEKIDEAKKERELVLDLDKELHPLPLDRYRLQLLNAFIMVKDDIHKAVAELQSLEEEALKSGHKHKALQARQFRKSIE